MQGTIEKKRWIRSSLREQVALYEDPITQNHISRLYE